MQSSWRQSVMRRCSFSHVALFRSVWLHICTLGPKGCWAIRSWSLNLLPSQRCFLFSSIATDTLADFFRSVFWWQYLSLHRLESLLQNIMCWVMDHNLPFRKWLALLNEIQRIIRLYCPGGPIYVVIHDYRKFCTADNSSCAKLLCNGAHSTFFSCTVVVPMIFTAFSHEGLQKSQPRWDPSQAR